MIHPHNKYKEAWDILVIIATLYIAVETPLWLIFDYEQVGIIGVLAIIMPLIFLADLLVCFKTGYFSPTGKYIADTQKVAKQYLRTWFFIDALSIIPFDLIAEYYTQTYLQQLAFAEPSTFVWVLKLLALVRLLRLLHIFGIVRRWMQHDFMSPNMIRLGFVIFWLSIVAHWIACGWVALGMINPALPNFDNYLRALYWCVTTLTTIGYGDITPTTNIQIIYTMMVQMIGAAAYGYLIGNLASLLTNIDVAKANFRDKMGKVENFVRFHHVPKSIQEEIHNYYQYLWENRRGFSDSDILEELPHSLKLKIALYLNKDVIEKVPLFKHANRQLISQIALHLQPAIYLPGEYIFKAGDYGEEMYFISHGSVEVISPDEKTIMAILHEGDYFGEIALLNRSERTASVRASEFCDIYYLERKTLEKVVKQFPNFVQELKDMANKREKKI